MNTPPKNIHGARALAEEIKGGALTGEELLALRRNFAPALRVRGNGRTYRAVAAALQVRLGVNLPPPKS